MHEERLPEDRGKHRGMQRKKDAVTIASLRLFGLIVVLGVILALAFLR